MEKDELIFRNEVLGTLADIMREMPTPIDHYDNGTYNGLDRAFEIIENAPAVDAVEVVRCRDCKRQVGGLCPMETPWNLTDDNGFCSYGERRTTDGE